MSDQMWSDDNGLATTGDTRLVVESEHARTALQRLPEGDSPLALMVAHAQGIVRDPAKMIAQAKQIGGLLAGDGFYRFPTGGAQVQGASVTLAQALVQVWRGCAFQVRVINSEHLSTGGRRIHLRATVTDMCSLVASEVDQVVTTSAPPGKFATREEQAERWHSMQLQSAVSKIARNVILRVLPDWLVEAALQAAYAQDAQNATAGKSLPEARAGAKASLEKAGLSLDEMERTAGSPFDMWAVPQLAVLRDLYRDLQRGTVSVEQVRANLAGDAPTPPKANGKNALGVSSKKAEAPVVEATPA